jgi:hypothetical protein
MTASFFDDASTARITALAPSRFRRSDWMVERRVEILGSEEEEGGGGGW